LIHLLRSKANHQQVEEMLEELNPIIKLAVDIDRDILAGGGQMHADCEGVLLEDGSLQKDIGEPTGFRTHKYWSLKP